MSGDRDEQPVRIVRIDGHLRNLLPVAQPKMRPGRARVGGLVDAIAHRKIGTMQSFAAAHVDDIRIGGRDRDRADRAGRLVIEDRIPCAAEVVGLPHAAIHRADVEDIRLAGNAAIRARAPSAKRTDVAPMHLARDCEVSICWANNKGGENSNRRSKKKCKKHLSLS